MPAPSNVIQRLTQALVDPLRLKRSDLGLPTFSVPFCHVLIRQERPTRAVHQGLQGLITTSQTDIRQQQIAW